MIQNPVVKFPQILGAALSANVFVVIAQAIVNLKSYEWWKLAFIGLIFLWNLKDGIDDFKSYESQKLEGFSLAPTVTFRVISYMFLVIAVMNIDQFEKLILSMAAYFMTFVLWAANSLRRRILIKSNSDENNERMRRRRGWLILHGLCVIFCFSIFLENDFITISAIFMIYVIFLIDCVDCGTFTNEINETL